LGRQGSSSFFFLAPFFTFCMDSLLGVEKARSFQINPLSPVGSPMSKLTKLERNFFRTCLCIGSGKKNQAKELLSNPCSMGDDASDHFFGLSSSNRYTFFHWSTCLRCFSKWGRLVTEIETNKSDICTNIFSINSPKVAPLGYTQGKP